MPQVRDKENKDWLIELMNESGYHPDPGGMCFGVANMGMQAILAEEFNPFERRFLELINMYNERDDIHRIIDMLKEEIVNPSQQLQEDAKKSLISTLNLDDKLREMRKIWSAHLLHVEKIDFGQLKKELNKKENEFLYRVFIEQQLENCKNKLGSLETEFADPENEYMAFFEGVELYQRPGLHSPLFEKGAPFKQDTLLSAPRVLSKKLEQSGGISRISCFMGGYNSDELFQYFLTLKNELTAIKKPIALILGSGDHALTVGYDPALDQWLFVNGSCEPAHIPGEHVQEIAQSVFNELSSGNQCAFVTNIYCNKSNEEEFKKRMELWEKCPKFQEIHQIDAKKAKQSGAHLLLLSALDNDPFMAKTLIKEGVNPNLVADEKGITPMLIAICCNHIDVIKELLTCPLTTDMILNIQVNSLYQFGRAAQIDEGLVSKLVNKKINSEQPIDATTIVSLSLHELAVALGHTEISNLLHQYEQNQSEKSNAAHFDFFKTEEYLSKRPQLDVSKPAASPVCSNPFDLI
ncbi:ankyrin repeat domain-containing protein [Legionella sp. WA2022007384]